MNKLSIKLIVFLASLFVWASSVQSQVLEDFPQACMDASDNQPLPGHIIRLGAVIEDNNQISFLFPDQQAEQDLQQVEIAENVGLIGQDIDYDLFSSLAPTQNNFFVVAQIFVGDDNVEPVVTCVSGPILLSSYRPNYYYEYESGFNWLNRRLLIERLAWRHHRNHQRWEWRDNWRSRFDGIRNNFRKYKDKDRFHHRKYRKNLDDRRFDRRKDRGDFDKNDRKFDRSKIRPIVKPNPDMNKPVDRKDRNPKIRVPMKKAKDMVADEKDKMKKKLPMIKKSIAKKVDDIKERIMPNKKQDDDDKEDDSPRRRRGR